jgi:hypothetical protein
MIKKFCVYCSQTNYVRLCPPGNREGYSFPFHSAGPFGDDVFGEWLTANDFVLRLSLAGFVWTNIHATNKSDVKTSNAQRKRVYIAKYLLGALRYRLERCSIS